MSNNAIMYLTVSECVSSFITFNRKVQKKWKILFFIVFNLCMLGFQSYKYFENKPSNVYEQFHVDRDNANMATVNEILENVYDLRLKGSLTLEEYLVSKHKGEIFKDQTKRFYYEVTNTCFNQTDSENQASTSDTVVIKQALYQSIFNTVVFYMATFILFNLILAASQQSVAKCVSFLCLIFCYLEISYVMRYKDDPELDRYIGTLIPYISHLNIFEKEEILRCVFQFFIQICVGFARVIFDAPKRFEKEDKTKYFENIDKTIKEVSLKIISWETTDKLAKPLKEIKNKAAEEKKPKKPNRCGQCITYGIIIWFGYGVIKSVFFSS